MWHAVSLLLDELATSDDVRLTSGDVSAICDGLEDAATSADREGLKKASNTLEQGFRALLARGEPELREAVIEGQAGAARDAFTLGQLNLAQAFAARAFERRADAGFADMLFEGRFERIVRALAERPMSGVELAERLGLAEETVSRNLKELRAQGATEFRRDGTQLINFLAPAAAAVVASRTVAPLPRAGSTEGLAALQERKLGLQEHLRSPATFVSREDDRLAA